MANGAEKAFTKYGGNSICCRAILHMGRKPPCGTLGQLAQELLRCNQLMAKWKSMRKGSDPQLLLAVNGILLSGKHTRCARKSNFHTASRGTDSFKE